MRQSLRFTILERDQFRCRYCGRAASAEVALQVDHIHPRSKGGTDDPDNLVTACWDCNIGKGARKLRPIPPRRPRGPRMPSTSAEMEELRLLYPVGSWCSTPLHIAAIGVHQRVPSYHRAYQLVKSLPNHHPLPPERATDYSWFGVVKADPFPVIRPMLESMARVLDSPATEPAPI